MYMLTNYFTSKRLVQQFKKNVPQNVSKGIKSELLHPSLV